MRHKKAGRIVKMVLVEGAAKVLELVPEGARTRYVEDLLAEDFKKGKMGVFSRYAQREVELAGMVTAIEALVPARTPVPTSSYGALSTQKPARGTPEYEARKEKARVDQENWRRQHNL